MQERTLDPLIIGGGITGAGVALQAAASGLDTGLIEMQDFAEGISSRSTKLVHGGLRYLKQFDVEVVSDTVSERAVVALPPPSQADPAGGPAHRISRSAYNGARQLISRMSPPMIWVGCQEKMTPACF